MSGRLHWRVALGAAGAGMRYGCGGLYIAYAGGFGREPDNDGGPGALGVEVEGGRSLS